MIKIVWTEEKKNKAIEILTKYFAEHGSCEFMCRCGYSKLEPAKVVYDIAHNVLKDNEGIIYPDED
jgi:hypothetical protein